MMGKLGTKIRIEVEVFWLCHKCKFSIEAEDYAVEKEFDLEKPICKNCGSPMIFTISFDYFDKKQEEANDDASGKI